MLETENSMPFGRGNYLLLLLSIALVSVGFFVMSLETAEYGQGFLGLTLGPLTVLSGFGVGFLAIFYRGKSGASHRKSE